jgi:enamine deaminase RidA (YjgF/YER057c/UK114 family)
MAVVRKYYNPESLGKKLINGKLLYSHAVAVRGGTRIILSGQVARDAQGNTIGVGDMRAQVIAVCEHIKIALTAAGATFKDVVRSTTYITNMQEYFRHVDARLPYFGDEPPTSTTIQISALAGPELLVEIEVEAVIDDAPKASVRKRAATRRASRPAARPAARARRRR